MIYVYPLMTCLGVEAPHTIDLIRWDGENTSESPAWFTEALETNLSRVGNQLHAYSDRDVDPYIISPGMFFGRAVDSFSKEDGWVIYDEQTLEDRSWWRKQYDGFTYHFEDAPGERFARYGFGVSRTEDTSWWWVDSLRRWMTHDDVRASGVEYASSSCRCNTFKALRSHVRDHWVPGAEFLWGGRFGGRVIVTR